MAYNGALLFKVDGPLLELPPQGSVRAGHFLTGFKDVVRRLGGHHRNLLDKLHIDLTAADDPDYPLDGVLATAMLEHCSDTLDDELFGFHLAEYQDADVYGCLAILGRSAPTLRIGLQSIIDYVPLLHSPGADAELATVGDVAEYRWRPYADFACHEQAVHHGLLLAAKLLRSLGGNDFRPSYVTSMCNMRRNLEHFERRFNCSVHGRSKVNSIGFSAEFLDRPLTTANPTIFGLVSSYLGRVRNAKTPTLQEQVENFVANHLRSGNFTIERCAARLDTSPRTLQKRLAMFGTTFFDIVEQQRFQAAKVALSETDHTLDEIADLLGYSEKSSFCRAFKRWTDVTAQTYRESHAPVRNS